MSMNNGRREPNQYLVFIGALLFFLFACGLAFYSNDPVLAVPVLFLSAVLTIMGSIGPSSIQKLILKKGELKVVRHIASQRENTIALSVLDKPLLKSSANTNEEIQQLVEKAESRTTIQRSATDYYLLATDSETRDEFTKGISYVTQGLEVDTEDHRLKAALYGRYGSLLTNIGANDFALEHYQKAIEIYPDSPAFYDILAIHYGKVGNLEEAEAAAKKAIELDPYNTLTYTNLGTTLEQFDRSEDAEEYYNKALEIDPEYAPASFGLGRLLLKHDRFEEAEKVARKLIGLNSKDSGYRSIMGLSLYRLGRIDEAEVHFRQALRIAPNDVVANLNYAGWLADMGRCDESMEYVNKASALDPKDERIQEQAEYVASKRRS